MAVEKRLFLGIKQVTKETFSALDDSEKVGYLWFVRNEDTEHLEIYLGTRMYGETNNDKEYIDEIAQKIASAVGLTSGLTLPDGFEYENVIAAFDGKQDVIDDLDEIRSGATLGLTSVQEETDPTVPDWAKQTNKPSYTAEEVGALPSSTTIPTKTSELINDSGFVTGATTYSAGTNIEITGTGNSINALGYVYHTTKSSFATGLNTTASGNYSHAEGRKTNATNNGAHSEGTYSDASGVASHSEGYGSTNYHNIASGDGSHTEGVCTRSQNKSEHAEGSANVSHKASNTYGDAGNTQHSIGIGTHYNSTKNAVEVMQNGDYYLLGVGGYQGTDTKVQNASIRTIQEVINSKADAYETATNDDIDFMFVTEIKLIREQTNDKNYIDWLVNTRGETMEYNGQTYYKWVSWANDGYNNDGSWTLIEHPNIIVLTNTLDVQLPFNTNSPEFEYWIQIDDEGGIGANNYIHGDYTQKTFQ